MIVSLILLTALQAAPGPVEPSRSGVMAWRTPQLEPSACDAMLREAGLAPQPQPRGSSSLLDRNPDGGEARRYLLLDRRYRGCPAPISFDVPNQPRALGRELSPGPNVPATPRRPGS
ncbi:hypothetical protein [Brevundimonas sp. PAMC22021]|uniref:hypothetical protein n=1 Tax=Brevundimonas sp. PAMC22021 TaxID=2861285 RepID=UPI001C6334FA|nr:hypothetical protein [Brevundimonas sp. PAMC22021]QYF86538.1 hypothetical protein KY493_12020 [Brevundimonas sp. PAMC22021]